MVCDMAEAAEPALRLVHLMGAHSPYMSAEIDSEMFFPLCDCYCSPGEDIKKAIAQQKKVLCNMRTGNWRFIIR